MVAQHNPQQRGPKKKKKKKKSAQQLPHAPNNTMDQRDPDIYQMSVVDLRILLEYQAKLLEEKERVIKNLEACHKHNQSVTNQLTSVLKQLSSNVCSNRQ